MIPITFNKDDLNNVKKGNVRGQDLASFLSISMPKRAGVLDIFDDPCGYVQITPTTGYATVTMKKGYVNIYGRCIYVEQGEQVQIALPTSGTVTGTFGIRVNLGETGANEVAWFTKTTTLQQDNILNNEINGVYEFALFNYTATSGGLTLTKVATIIENIDDYLKGANFTTQPTADKSTKLATTEFSQNLIDTIRTVANKAQKGSLKLDNGIIIKWGFVLTQRANTNIYVPFDTTYPFTSVYNVQITPRNYISNNFTIGLIAYDNNGFSYVVTSDTIDCMYLAIGV
ncbi:MAG: hypothetical protein J6T74_02915 [Clostridia bacterium]|nr:hypothetical protein [Clostridia bacterium]MBO7712021.1 hypothetical protein [Methanobrevibacter sp.]MBO7712094.1 hypothetical protein [Methanobrevibacter sp.]